MNTIIFIGPPGSGKGTQAKRLANDMNFSHVSVGSLLRQKRKNAPLLASIMDRGEILPNALVLDVLYEHLEKENLFNNVIIDGSPRSLEQYEKMKEWFSEHNNSIDIAIFIKISKEEAIKRLSARREDKITGITYNLIFNPPPADVDQNNLITRKDDQPESVAERFDEYHKLTEPVIAQLKADGILHEIDGERSIDEVYGDVKQIFNNG